MIEAYLAVAPVGGAVLISLCVSGYMRFRYRRQPMLDLTPPARRRPSDTPGPLVVLDEPATSPDPSSHRGHRRRDGGMPGPSTTEGGNLVVLDE